MKQRKRFTSFGLALVMSFAMLGQMPVAKAANEVKVDILEINDFHGALKEDGKNVGASKLVNEIKKAKESNPNTVVVSAGDNFNGSAVSNLLYGEPVAKVFKEAGFVISAVGNHEFDWGIDKIANWKTTAGLPFLAANIYEKSTGKPVTWADPYKIIDVNGVKVGFIGLTTRATAYTTKPDVVANLDFKDPVEIAKQMLPVVKKQGADIVILLTHIGAFQDKTTKEITTEEPGLLKIEGVNGIIFAHTHQPVSGVVNNIAIVEGYYNGRDIGKLSFTIDKDTKTIIKSESSLDVLYERAASLKEDAATKAMFDGYTQKVGPILNEVVGKTVKELDHNRMELSTLGQASTDIMRAYSKADIAVTNGGGLRTSIPAGDITVGKMYEVMPFDNVLSNYEMTGAQVKDIFEHGIENKEIGSVQFSGVKVVYVPGAEKGKKVVKIYLDNGTEIDPAKKYKVVTNDFMGTGGDNYTMFKAAKSLGDTVAIRDVLIQAIKGMKVVDYKKVDRLIKYDPNAPMPTVEPVKVPTPEKVVEPVKVAVPVKNVEVANQNVVKATEYVVVKGDMLYKIGKKLNLDWNAIAKLNALKNSNLIFPGQKLLLPQK